MRTMPVMGSQHIRFGKFLSNETTADFQRHTAEQKAADHRYDLQHAPDNLISLLRRGRGEYLTDKEAVYLLASDKTGATRLDKALRALDKSALRGEKPLVFPGVWELFLPDLSRDQEFQKRPYAKAVTAVLEDASKRSALQQDCYRVAVNLASNQEIDETAQLLGKIQANPLAPTYLKACLNNFDIYTKPLKL